MAYAREIAPKLTKAGPPFREVIAAECPWIALSDAQLAQLEAHHELLKRWNAKLNLTATLDIRKHFGESLFLASCLEGGGLAVADIGSGGGFPGLPLAVAKPAWRVTLVESDRRKSIFLREAASLVLNASVMTVRAEDITGRFDWLVSRAVTPEFVAEMARKQGAKIAMILRDPPVVEGVVTEFVRELPWPGTGSVWVARSAG